MQLSSLRSSYGKIAVNKCIGVAKLPDGSRRQPTEGPTAVVNTTSPFYQPILRRNVATLAGRYGRIIARRIWYNLTQHHLIANFRSSGWPKPIYGCRMYVWLFLYCGVGPFVGVIYHGSPML